MRILNHVLCSLFAILSLSSVEVRGQTPAAPVKPEMMMENCPGLVASRSPLLQKASLRLAALNADAVRMTYVGHSTFLLESPKLVRIATDYNDYVKPSLLPDIVTMNRAHSTHYTDSPNLSIKHILRGWHEGSSPARHDVNYQDVRVRNVTNIRSYDGGTQRHGNSIFIFETANLCIAHLGHLHHTLTQQQLNEIGPWTLSWCQSMEPTRSTSKGWWTFSDPSRRN